MKLNISHILILLSLSLLLTGCVNQTGNYDNFAKCLNEKNVKMYGTSWCSHCRNQKDLFGTSFEYINYVDCDKNRDECLEAGIKGYPAWAVSAKMLYGEQKLEKLSELSGCELK